jgi:hypothetical protein
MIENARYNLKEKAPNNHNNIKRIVEEKRVIYKEEIIAKV